MNNVFHCSTVLHSCSWLTEVEPDVVFLYPHLEVQHACSTHHGYNERLTVTVAFLLAWSVLAILL